MWRRREGWPGGRWTWLPSLALLRVCRGLGQVPLLLWASISPRFRREVEMRGRGSGAHSRPAGQRGLLASAHRQAGWHSPPQVEKHRGLPPALSSPTEERPAGRPMQQVLMKPDSPAEKRPPLPRRLYFSVISLEGAVTSSVCLSENHFPNHREGREQRGASTGQACRPRAGRWQAWGPPGPRAASCRRCQRELCWVFLERPRSVPIFFKRPGSFLTSWDFRIRREH